MKQTHILFASFIAMAVLLTGCGSTNTTTNTTANDRQVTSVTAAAEGTDERQTKVVLVTAEEGKKLLADNASFVLLDVREPDEYAQEHIPGSILLPLGNIAEKAAEVVPDVNTPIIVYCRSGRRSAIGAEELAGMGYTTVYDMGGILNWPYETETGMTTP